MPEITAQSAKIRRHRSFRGFAIGISPPEPLGFARLKMEK